LIQYDIGDSQSTELGIPQAGKEKRVKYQLINPSGDIEVRACRTRSAARLNRRFTSDSERNISRVIFQGSRVIIISYQYCCIQVTQQY